MINNHCTIPKYVEQFIYWSYRKSIAVFCISKMVPMGGRRCCKVTKENVKYQLWKSQGAFLFSFFAAAFSTADSNYIIPGDRLSTGRKTDREEGRIPGDRHYRLHSCLTDNVVLHQSALTLVSKLA